MRSAVDSKCMLAYLGGCGLSQRPVLAMLVLPLLNLSTDSEPPWSPVIRPILYISSEDVNAGPRLRPLPWKGVPPLEELLRGSPVCTPVL